MVKVKTELGLVFSRITEILGQLRFFSITLKVRSLEILKIRVTDLFE